MNSIRLSDLRATPLPPDFDPSSPRSDSKVLNFADLVSLGRRRLKAMAAVVILVTGAAAAASFLLPKVYSATSTIVLERTETRPYDNIGGTAPKGVERDKTGAETEIAVMKSRTFLARVVDSFGLVDDPWFNTYLPEREKTADEMSLTERAAGLARWLATTAVDPVLQTLGVGPGGVRELPKVDVMRDRAITTLTNNIQIARSGESLAITIRVTAWSPELSAKLANGLADQYVSTSVEVKSEAGDAVDLIEARSNQSFLIALRNEEARLLRERASLAAGFDAQHPKIVNADASIQSVRTMINRELERLALDLQNEAKKPGARLVSPATVPGEPSFPRPSLMISAAAIASMFLAIGVAIMLEASDRRLRTREQTIRASGLPHVGYIPRMPRGGLGLARRTYAYLRDRPRSAYAEAMRSIFMACRVPNTDRPHQALMVTSCLPDEGKTSLAVGLAVMAAADDRRTVLVDLDVRRPGIFETMGIRDGGRGLERVLHQNATLSDAVYRVPDLPNLHVLGLESAMLDFDRISTQRLKALMAALRADYDVIVFDTPPVLIVDDANWLSPMVDGILMVLRWGETREEALSDASRHLANAGGPIIGTVLNDVDPKVQAKHGYGGMPQYSRLANRYIIN
ncbi:polysaccharide biosynthesis tyrosine autokinase [Prosthecomicrobium sp. N25]|uniref:polysaccharide biosynthesis tyrosine autokinase n=1 Tax=Prosthecomicrobium sp. N25 TaxID=3129254 RepID=UPI0030785ADB